MATKRGGIYFVSLIEAPQFIKIGKTKDFQQRFRCSMTYLPFTLKVELLIDVDCTSVIDNSTERTHLEELYHQKFIKHHHMGEWFKLDNDIITTVSKLQKELDFTPFIWDRANPSAIERLLKLPEPDVELNPV